MKDLDGQHFDTVIIGCGMSGLGAGIRLAMYDRKVLILEKHNAPGGLNSFYFMGGRKCDVGLHALTNFVPAGVPGALTKIFRQLRIPRDAFDLSPQLGSRIAFPDVNLRFGNGIELLASEVEREFPAEADHFRALVKIVEEHDALDTSRSGAASAREVLASLIKDQTLIEMLLCPVLYYGSSQENDVDFDQFCILFRAVYLEGFARPYEGVRTIMRALLDRYKELGGTRKMKMGVRQIVSDGTLVSHLELDDGSRITADHVISTAGAPETWALLSETPQELAVEQALPRLSFCESMAFLDCQPADLGWNDTIIFFNDGQRFDYRVPETAVDYRSGVICFPNNYDFGEGRQLDEGVFRVTALANYGHWADASESVYQEMKQEARRKIQTQALKFLPGSVTHEDLERHTTFFDLFTPRTVKKFTGHIRGAVYGSPLKRRNGATHLQNLYIAGTDQGFLGIVGALLSGISMANSHVLTK